MKTAPEYELISVEINGPVCNICLDREQKYNAMNQQMIQEITEALSWSAKHSVSQQGELFDENNSENLRIIVLSAAGKHFSAGADINMMRDAGSKTAEENREDSRRLDALFNGLWSHPCFTIGIVQGLALGGGAGLIACLEKVFFQKTRASQALLKIINSNPKWGKRDRSTITDCFYSCIRWKSKYEYFIGEKFVVINQDDLIKLIGVWLTLNDFNISNYIEYEGFDSKKILNNSKKIINDPVISFSIPDWMDQIGNTELPNTWIKEIE